MSLLLVFAGRAGAGAGLGLALAPAGPGPTLALPAAFGGAGAAPLVAPSLWTGTGRTLTPGLTRLGRSGARARYRLCPALSPFFLPASSLLLLLATWGDHGGRACVGLTAAALTPGRWAWLGPRLHRTPHHLTPVVLNLFGDRPASLHPAPPRLQLVLSNKYSDRSNIVQFNSHT